MSDLTDRQEVLILAGILAEESGPLTKEELVQLASGIISPIAGITYIIRAVGELWEMRRRTVVCVAASPERDPAVLAAILEALEQHRIKSDQAMDAVCAWLVEAPCLSPTTPANATPSPEDEGDTKETPPAPMLQAWCC